jgi:phosphohistidine phosphatase
MQIYLMRHADAAAQIPGQNDGERPLTAKGSTQTVRVLQWLASRGVQIDCVICSPLLRAMQTAKPLVQELNAELLVDDRLRGGRLTVQALADLVEKAGRPTDVMLVGHEPDLSGLIHELTDGHVEMQKAAVAMITCHRILPGRGTLALLVPPHMT